MKKKIVAVVTDNGEYIPLEDIQKKEEIAKKKARHLKNKGEFETLINIHCGSFYFNFYTKFPNLDRQYLFRFIYLCTFMDYNNVLCFGNTKDNKMTERDLQEVLNLSERETIRTKKALIKNNMIIINKDKSISINDEYCKKGEVIKGNIRGSVRMFEEGIKELYEKATAREHKKIALLIELLPYINFKHNIICKNPYEGNIYNVETYSMSDIMKIVGYKNVTQLKKDLLGLRVKDELVIAIVETGNGRHLVVNPRVYYKGNRIEDLESIINIFRVKGR